VTVLVGVRCTDGVVIGADSVATSATGANALMSIESNDKIRIFPDGVIMAATGAVGFSQRLTHHIEQAISGHVFRNLSAHDCTVNISKRLLTDFQNSLVQSYQPQGLRFGALLAAAIKGEPCLIEYGTTDFQPEIKQDKLFYVSMGSGQVLAEPFLAFVSRVLWKGIMPTVKDAMFGVYWVLDHTIKLAPGGVGGAIKLAILHKPAAAWIAEEIQDQQEPAMFIEQLEAHIGRFALTQTTINEAESKPIPLTAPVPAANTPPTPGSPGAPAPAQ
jgi:hypothetical protein